MQNRYDPMTGELLQSSETETSGETETNFDPMTGQPIKKEAQETEVKEETKENPQEKNQEEKVAEQPAEPEMRFDPMTGQPLVQTGFDPMTGQPLTGAGFDPMTGQPLVQTGFDPMTGQPVYGTVGVTDTGRKRHVGPLIAAVAAGVVVMVGIVIGCVTNGTFLSKPDKVLLAAKRTLADQPQFMKDLGINKATSILKSNNYKLEMKANIEGSSVEGDYVCTKSEKQLRGNVSVPQGLSVDMSASLTASKLKVNVPLLSPDVYVWNYTEDDDGYIMDVLEGRGIRYEDLSEALSTLYSPEDQTKDAKELVKTLHTQIRELEWEKTDSKEFRIDGKSRKTKGYRVTITADDAEDFLDAFERYSENNFGEVDEISSSIKQMYDEVRYFPDMECEFYIYKNRLAAVYMDVDDFGEVELLFKGGDFRMQNMELTMSGGYGSSSVELIGKTKNSKETYELVADRTTLLEMEYDKESGKYEILFDDYGDKVVIDGKIMSERGQVGASMRTGNNLDMEIILSKDAKVEPMTGQEIDVMDMSENDWMMLEQSFYGNSSLDAFDEGEFF